MKNLYFQFMHVLGMFLNYPCELTCFPKSEVCQASFMCKVIQSLVDSIKV